MGYPHNSVYLICIIGCRILNFTRLNVFVFYNHDTLSSILQYNSIYILSCLFSMKEQWCGNLFSESNLI